MDHSHHGDMDMGHGHDGMDMPMCSMNMLFTWDTNNLCIVFRSWRVTGPVSLLFTLLGVVLLTAGYEAVREYSRRYEAGLKARMDGMTINTDDAFAEHSSLLGANVGNTAQAEEQKGKVVKAALYGLQVFYSFFIMLLFMTYNGWIMLAVGIGAFVGYLMFGGSSVEKSAACH